MQLVIVTGLSGSGKSIALKALEDGGHYCVDNLPAKLLPETVQHLEQAGQTRLAVSIDSRSSALEALPSKIAALRAQGIDVQVLFLESSVETLVKRFSETRRRHPLSGAGRTLAEGIALEREMLAPMANIAHRIDTSKLSANTLRFWVREFIDADQAGITLLFASFAFKQGIPLDADFVFDVRCLPNPHYEAALQPLTGRDQPVIAWLEEQPVVEQMYSDIHAFVAKWLPCFVQDNRHYLTVAIGCTGGQHRSVYFVERLAAAFRIGDQRVLVRHRELS
jgi:UPF0042 nucleotide-binding protein